MTDDVYLCHARVRSLLEQLGIKHPPVDVESVAKSLGLNVSLVNLGPRFRGEYLRESMILEVEQNTHRHRQRFTIAHGIGHYLLGHDPVAFADDSIVEWQANTFAAELLMPERWVRVQWDIVGSYQAMADLFDVSAEAMFYRLMDLDILSVPKKFK